MKKNSIIRILTGTLCLAMMMSVTTAAFAADNSTVNTSGSIPAVKTEEAQVVGDYRTEEGTISSVEAKDGYYQVVLSNENMGVIFNAKEDVFVFDQNTGKTISVKDLKKDMKLVAVMPSNTPMTLSLPPQISGAIAFVVKADNASIDVSLYNDNLTNASNSLKLNISEDTKIIDIKGTKKIYKEEDLKGQECIVLYKYTTRSIPAQTSPETVIVLDKIATDVVTEVKTKDEVSTKAVSDDSYVELRSAAEAKGYKVEWQSNKKPIVLTKNDMRIELNIGSSEFTFTHKTKDLKALDKMTKLDMPVALEKGKTVIQSSFIEALE